jgi:ubiquinone/menaquinone biosynthesis C-methylase UbiE
MLSHATMDASGSHDANQQYYDAFSKGYERIRGENDPGGYHDLLDGLEAGYVERFGLGRDVLEVGCGTGLVLRRIAEFARSAKGVDLSPGMLEKARARGLDVRQGSATELPFPDASFDVTCSFKVLPHVPDIERALAEMARVLRPRGVLLAEFYNPNSFRGLIKRLGPKLRIAKGADEGNVYTRFDSPERVQELAPAGTRFVGARGVRIATVTGWMMKPRFARRPLTALETTLADSPLKNFAGFYIAAFEKESG